MKSRVTKNVVLYSLKEQEPPLRQCSNVGFLLTYHLSPRFLLGIEGLERRNVFLDRITTGHPLDNLMATLQGDPAVMTGGIDDGGMILERARYCPGGL
jgi:hypothetical protein